MAERDYPGILLGFVGDAMVDRDDRHEVFSEVRALITRHGFSVQRAPGMAVTASMAVVDD